VSSSIKELLIAAKQRLHQKNIEGAYLAPDLILAHLLKVTKEHLYAYPEKTVPPNLAKHFWELIERREKGEPLAYILGKKEFYDLELEVAPGVLIPRPETELIIDIIQEYFSPSQKFIFADLCTGSGCLGITIAKKFPLAKGICLDLSAKALQVASKNKNKYNLKKQLLLVQGNLTHFFFQKQLDLIVSNPPYLSYEEVEKSSLEVKGYEPHLALLGGKKGLKFYPFLRRLIQQALKPRGIFIAECSPLQKEDLKTIFSSFPNLKIIKDLAGRNRFVFVQNHC